MKECACIKKGAYFDSVTLMTVGKNLTAMPGVREAADLVPGGVFDHDRSPMLARMSARERASPARGGAGARGGSAVRSRLNTW